MKGIEYSGIDLIDLDGDDLLNTIWALLTLEKFTPPPPPPPVGGTVHPTDKLPLYMMVGTPATLALAAIAVAIAKKS